MIDGLAATGFVDGKNISIRRYNAENDLPTANAIAKEMTSGAYDLVLTASTLSLQTVANANRAGKALHVFALVSDPFGAGVGISRENPLQHPRHLVGYGTMQPVAEAFELAKRLSPGLKIVGEAWNPAEANSEVQTNVARETCRRLGIQLVEANVEKTSDVFEAASSLVARGVDALWVGGDVTVMTAIDAVVRAARKGNIPVFTSMPRSAEQGALFDLGANYYEVGRLAGTLAGDLLNGRDPSKIAVENVLPITLLVNREALNGLKDPWTFPDDVLRTAEQVGARAGFAPKRLPSHMS
jgi:putative ABC transport system substrate-binding protein